MEKEPDKKEALKQLKSGKKLIHYSLPNKYIFYYNGIIFDEKGKEIEEFFPSEWKRNI
jgi:hypothetical protein